MRAGTVAGAGTISANGGTGVGPLNDGGGGGGAGGSVMLVAQFGGLGGLTANAHGGVGTDTWPADAGGPTDYHGPSGGGGGGVILSSDGPAAAASYPVVTVTVPVAQSAASSVSSSASVAGGGEVRTTNDTATDPTTVTSQADVAVSKSAGASTVTVGSNVTFTITAHNAGPSDATGVQVTDLLPAGLSFVSANPAAGTYTSSTGVWNIGPLAAGATTTLGLTATVTATGAITNSATKTGEVEIDPNGSNNTASTVITGRPTAALPGPPNGGMASVALGAWASSVNRGGAAVMVALLLLAASTSIAVAGRRRSHGASPAA